ncbi:hypothetical protein FF011L_12320 [Roseimaritima multifibrata]|uniref:Uncharacterized protein n=1 Tax=Roseimaritima multifibrata TaxID=1930274 RepID=A0A517MC69_9BACT|nr:hypothetical protein [Roseimaritima multifibrata]QDS92489.1 hypothetical protein FF011L_12320 [Roseimaritima multifibrata]
MDPTSTFNAMLEAYANSDHEEAREHATNLMDWLLKGGFPPRFFLAAKSQSVFELSTNFAEQASAEVCRRILRDDNFGPDETGGEYCDPEPSGPCHPSELIRNQCDLP